MNTQEDPFHDIENRLRLIRQQAKPQRGFPQDIWDTIIRLTETHPISIVSRRLSISPVYLKQKIKKSHKTAAIDFSEIPSLPTMHAETVSIELISDLGMRAKIQGPASCLNYLSVLFRR